jgi:hypothetical protein
MAEIEKNDQDRLMDETLSLFQDAIADTKTVFPPEQFGRAVEPKDVPPPEPPEKRAASLFSHAVSIAWTVAGFAPKAVQTASPSLQPPVAEQAMEKPIGGARSDSLVGQALSMMPIVPTDKPNVIEAASPPSPNPAEAVVLSLQQSVEKPASKDVLPLERPTQEKPPSLIDHAHALVKKVVISEHKAVLVNKIVVSEHEPVQAVSPSSQPPVAKQAREKPVGDARSDPLVDQTLSMMPIVPTDEPHVVEVASPPSLNAAEAAVLSLQQPVEKSERPAQEKPPSLIDHVLSIVVEATPTALKTTVPLPQQFPVGQLSPKERLDMDRADIRKRVAIFKEHQQRFQREREEYYATTMAKVGTTR